MSSLKEAADLVAGDRGASGLLHQHGAGVEQVEASALRVLL
jgi:hypothetical protein